MAQTDNLPEVIEVKDHYQGDTFPGLRFNVTRNGVPKDLTGATITLTFLLRNRREATETKVLEIGTGLTVVDAANEIFDMDEIPGADMDWNSGDWYAECEIIYADAEVKSPFTFVWKVHQDKTQNNS